MATPGTRSVGLRSIAGSPRRASESFDEAFSQRSVRIPQTQDAQVDEGGFAAQLPLQPRCLRYELAAAVRRRREDVALMKSTKARKGAGR
jgi:hypothetical protein